MYKTLDKTLVDALSWAGVKSLPEANNGENFYIKALALVAKRDGTLSYVALRKGRDGKDTIVKDFGSVSQISEIKEVYPYMYLDASFVPEFTTKKKEERIKWLSMTEPGKDYEAMSLRELNLEVLNVAMQKQLKSLR
jgi:hypothetical protein